MNLKLIEILKNSVQDLSISSVSIDGDVVDFRSIKNYSIKSLSEANIVISNKYVNVLVKKGACIEDVVKLLHKTPHCYVLTNKGKFLSFDVTHHSALSLINRFLYVYIMEDIKFEKGVDLESIYEEYFNDMVDVITGDISDIGNNSRVHDLIRDIMKSSFNHKLENVGRVRDSLAFLKRNKKHQNCNRYFSHPFLFIIQDNILQTVELYSSCQDFRHLNKLTKKKSFNRLILDKLGRT